MPPKFYAVARGRAVGVFSSWGETQPLVNGFVGARYKSFATLDEASQFVASERSTSEHAPSVGLPANIVAPQNGAFTQLSHLSSGSPAAAAAKLSTDGHAPCEKIYAVARGRRVGLFSTWAEAETLVKGYVGARYKSFSSRTEAEAFLKRESLGALLFAAAEAAKVEIRSNATEQNNVVGRDNTIKELGDPSMRDNTRIVGTSATTNNNYNYKAVLGAHSSSFHTAQTPGVSARLSRDFPSSLEKPLVVYTDGACPNNGNAAMHPRAGYGVHYPKHENEESACGSGNRGAFPLPPDLSRSVPAHMKQTNNVGELMAVNAAVRQVVERDRGDGCLLDSSLEKAEINSCMETGGSMRAAAAISLSKQRTQPLIINTDSKYCIEGATQWMISWAKRGWRLKAGGGEPRTEKLFGADEPDQDGFVRNVGLWQELHGLLQERRRQMEDALVFLVSTTDAHLPEVRCLGRKRARSPSPSTHIDEKETCGSSMSREKAREIAQKYAVIFNHVRGHCGIPGNEEADRLAVMGAVGMGK